MVGNRKTIRAAAIQVDTKIGQTDENLAACQKLVEIAVDEGANWVGLPEFFNTGVSWEPDLVNKIEFQDGKSASFLQSLSKKYSIVLGGSFMCRLPGKGVRNRYLCFNKGELVGKHDKDLPTMWETAFYEGADESDTGYLGDIDGYRVGAAVCWEYIRTQTSRRLQGKVDVLIGGSHWWSLPTNWPDWLVAKTEAYNNENLMQSVRETARLIGAPVIHGSHCNTITCDFLGLPFLQYQGVLEGNAAVVDANGNILARRYKEEGEGIVIADVTPGNIQPDRADIPDRFWLRKRSVFAAFSWHYHGYLGKRWYLKNVRDKG